MDQGERRRPWNGRWRSFRSSSGAGRGDPFFKTAYEELKPSWAEIEAARAVEGLAPSAQHLVCYGKRRSSGPMRWRGENFRQKPSEVLDTETALDLIAVTEAVLTEIVELWHELPLQVVLVTDNGPAMKSRGFRNFVNKTHLLVDVRSRKYHPQSLGREERYHGSVKLEYLYRVLAENQPTDGQKF